MSENILCLVTRLLVFSLLLHSFEFILSFLLLLLPQNVFFSVFFTVAIALSLSFFPLSLTISLFHPTFSSSHSFVYFSTPPPCDAAGDAIPHRRATSGATSTFTSFPPSFPPSLPPSPPPAETLRCARYNPGTALIKYAGSSSPPSLPPSPPIATGK